MARSTRKPKWILLLFRLPTKPSRLRVRVWRQFHKLGAVSVKNAAYVLPYTESTREDFEWVSQDIVAAGGEASLFTADAFGAMGDAEVEALFREGRTRDYEALIAECETLRADMKEEAKKGHFSPGRIGKYSAACKPLQARLDDIAAIDFFDAPNKGDAVKALQKAREAIAKHQETRRGAAEKPGAPVPTKELRGKVWVTRRGLHIDRLASAWLITRFVDPKAHFKFVRTDGPRRKKKEEICFDMYREEFSHHGDDCTFETLLNRLGLRHDDALMHIAQIVHDIDLKDGKFGREEARGVDAVVRGLAEHCQGDENLRVAGQQVFDALYSQFQSRKKRKEKGTR